jgi:antitoxin ParD1/3/4
VENAEKLSITLPADMAQVVRDKVRSGAYASNSEVIRDALRSWIERERRLQSLDAGIMRGLADAEAGHALSVDEVRAQLLGDERSKRNASVK